LPLPGDETIQTALGYLHANCGLCHNPTSTHFARTDIDLWLRVETLGSVQSTPTWVSTVNVPVNTGFYGAEYRILPGDPAQSEVHRRMSIVPQARQMPPIGIEVKDDAALADMAAFIEALAALGGG
jgi:hypothetical protein